MNSDNFGVGFGVYILGAMDFLELWIGFVLLHLLIQWLYSTFVFGVSSIMYFQASGEGSSTINLYLSKMGWENGSGNGLGNGLRAVGALEWMGYCFTAIIKSK